MDKPVALITGSSKRLGKRIALSLAKNGYKIVINYHHSKMEAQRTKNELIRSGVDAIVIRADISDENQVKKMIQATIREFGALDLLVNNAAVFPKRCDLQQLSSKIWDEIMDINLKGAFLCSKYASKEMLKKKNGKIINIASLGAFLNWTGYIPYCISKSGILVLTRLLAKSLAPFITVNAIAPGTIIIPNEEKSNIHYPEVDKILLKKYGKPSDITDMVIYLATQADYITGQVFTVDGGASIL